MVFTSPWAKAVSGGAIEADGAGRGGHSAVNDSGGAGENRSLIGGRVAGVVGEGLLRAVGIFEMTLLD